MENVVVASFDPTVFSSNPLSDTKSFITVKWNQIVLNYPRLCTAHLALKMPIVLCTAASIRQREKARLFPRVKAVYFDAFTRQFHVPTGCPDKIAVEIKFREILNKTSTDEEIVRFFTRCANIAKNNYRRKNEHAHMPKAQPVDLELSDTEDEEPHSILEADRINRLKGYSKFADDYIEQVTNPQPRPSLFVELDDDTGVDRSNEYVPPREPSEAGSETQSEKFLGKERNEELNKQIRKLCLDAYVEALIERQGEPSSYFD